MTEGNGKVAPGDGHGVGAGTGPLTLSKKEFTSDQEVRWCPGCGDYAILAAVQGFLPELGIAPHNMVFVSGIGCSGRVTYYIGTYGVHRGPRGPPALATGVATFRPPPSGWVGAG